MSQKSKARKYKGMGYRTLQKRNKKNRAELDKEHQQWLKKNKYKNLGWDNVIRLYEKIEELQRKQDIFSMSLEELFLESDRIGNKYQTFKEKKEFQEKFQNVLQNIGDKIDRDFSDDKPESYDFRNLR